MSLTVQQLIDGRLSTRLHRLNNIEVHNNVGRLINATQFQMAFGNWITTTSGFPVYYLNGTIFTPNAIDTTKGVVTVNTFNPGDEVNATYIFNYFTTQELTNFLLIAMSKINNTAPASTFTLDDTVAGTTSSYPTDFEAFLTNYAYKLCLETILMDLMTWKAKLIWTDPVSLAGFVQGVLSSLDAEINATLPTLKARRFLNPRSISAGRYKTPAQVSDSTWQQYSIIRA